MGNLWGPPPLTLAEAESRHYQKQMVAALLNTPAPRPREEFRGVDHCIRCGHPLDEDDGFYCLACIYATEKALAEAEAAHTEAGDPDIDVDDPETKDEP